MKTNLVTLCFGFLREFAATVMLNCKIKKQTNWNDSKMVCISWILFRQFVEQNKTQHQIYNRDPLLISKAQTENMHSNSFDWNVNKSRKTNNLYDISNTTTLCPPPYHCHRCCMSVHCKLWAIFSCISCNISSCLDFSDFQRTDF